MLLPVFCAHGGFGPKARGDVQRRVLQDYDAFLRLVEHCDTMARPKDRLGLAPQWLRAAMMGKINRLAQDLPGRLFHIAGQLQEVGERLPFCGAVPAGYLLHNAPVWSGWCLVHATHVTADEVRVLAQSGAVAGLCPVTEANLGYGTFPAAAFLAAGGSWGAEPAAISISWLRANCGRWNIRSGFSCGRAM